MFAKINALLVLLFGDLSWAPPPWLTRLARSANAWTNAHRRTTLGLGFGVAVAVLGAAWYRDWQLHQPKPVTVSVELEGPGLTIIKNDREIIQALSVRFGESVIPLSQGENHLSLNQNETVTGIPLSARDPSHPQEIYPPITEGISIEPPIAGTWRWADGRRIMFTPKNDWPADTKYRVKLDKSLFPPYVLLARYELETTTPAFAVKMTAPEFYTDPHDPVGEASDRDPGVHAPRRSRGGRETPPAFGHRRCGNLRQGQAGGQRHAGQT